MRSLALSLVLAALALPGLSPAIGQQPATKLSLKVVTDRPDAIYKVGDKVSYSVSNRNLITSRTGIIAWAAIFRKEVEYVGRALFAGR
jgi:hypothetical protein